MYIHTCHSKGLTAVVIEIISPPYIIIVMHTGHAVSPLFRFISSNGSWVWMQMEGILRYKPGTNERQFWEIKMKMVR